jgi:hypothetical protein
MLRSTDGHAWTLIPSSPAAQGVMGDGKRIFASIRWNAQQPYFTCQEGSPMKWTPYTSPNFGNGGTFMAYDPEHHLLYSANESAGLWRIVTQ